MSIDFNGSTDEVGLPVNALLRPSLPVTISAWIRPDTITAGDGIFTTNKTTTRHRGFWFDITDGSGHMSADYGDNTGTAGSDRQSKISTGAVSTGAWQHVAACIRGASDMDIYINGADAGGAYSGTGGGMVYDTSTAGRIGSVQANLFDGRIAEVGLWNVSLSAAGVLALAKGVSPLRIRPESLIAYWPLYSTLAVDLGASALSATVVTGAAADHAPVGSPYPLAA